MAISVLTNVSVVYNSVDISDHVESVEIDFSYDDVEVTAMGATAHSFAPGLRNDKVVLNLFQDHATGEIDQTFAPLVGSATGATLIIKPVATTVSSQNPSYTMTCSPYSYQPISGKVGEASMTQVEMRPVAGGYIVRATT